MKVLLFTHKIDIDGMGCAVLGKLAFDDIKIVYCDTFEINQQIQKFIDLGEIENFDKIFVTDLCIKKTLIDYFDQTKALRDKTQILDHHKSEIEEGNGNYSFSHLQVEDEKGKCSGTSLFYNYLKEKNLLKPSEEIDLFVELTRQYDTWEWKLKFSNEQTNELNIAFSIMGIEKYVSYMFDKLKSGEKIFDDNLNEEIKKYKKHLYEKSIEYINSIKVVNINSYKVGVIENMFDVYKNDVAELIRTKFNRHNLDLVAMLIEDREAISFRSVKDNVDVGALAFDFGGKGHKAAGSCPKNEKILSALGICEK